MEERAVQPIRLTDNNTGNIYELDFNRESIMFAEGRGFKVEDVPEYPVTKIPEFFYYAFRMHHKNLSRAQTDNILYKHLGGLSKNALARLVDLYNQAAMSNNIVDNDEDMGKNGNMTVEL